MFNSKKWKKWSQIYIVYVWTCFWWNGPWYSSILMMCNVFRRDTTFIYHLVSCQIIWWNWFSFVQITQTKNVPCSQIRVLYSTDPIKREIIKCFIHLSCHNKLRQKKYFRHRQIGNYLDLQHFCSNYHFQTFYRK